MYVGKQKGGWKILLFIDDAVVVGASEEQLLTGYMEWKTKLERGGNWDE